MKSLIRNTFVTIILASIFGTIIISFLSGKTLEELPFPIEKFIIILLFSILLALSLIEYKSQKIKTHIKSMTKILDKLVKERRTLGDSDEVFSVTHSKADQWQGDWAGKFNDLEVADDLIDNHTKLENNIKLSITCDKEGGIINIRGEAKFRKNNKNYSGTLCGQGNIIQDSLDISKITLRSEIRLEQKNSVAMKSSGVGIIKLCSDDGNLHLKGHLITHRRIEDKILFPFIKLDLAKTTNEI